MFGDGFTGPTPVETLQDKIGKSQGRLYYWDTDLDSAVAETIRLRCESWVGTRGYHAWQLASMWWFERVGKHLGWHVPTSEQKLVCSEAVARAFWPWKDLRDKEHKKFDEVNPNSAYRRTIEIDITGVAT